MKTKLDMNTVLILLLIGLGAGILSGLIGIGGGIVIIPALVAFVGMSQQTAQGTTLALMLPPVGVLAVWEYYNKGFIDIKAALIMAITFAIGAFFGARIATSIEPAMMKKAFGVIIFLIGLKMIFGK